MSAKKTTRLSSDKHPQLDLFVPDILTWSPRSDRHSLEHPFFTLQKQPDVKIREYTSGDNYIKITPSVEGMANIWDKDILIFAISTMREAMNSGVDFSENRPINITAYNFLVSTNKDTGGQGYERLKSGLERMAGTRISTNITTDEQTIDEVFPLITKGKIVRNTATGNMETVEITLCDWLFNAVKNTKELLTINRDYFRLTSGLDRRLYEIARKHCGHQASWKIGMELLQKKTGSQSTLKRFRQSVKKSVDANALPDYFMTYDTESDQVTFRQKNSKAVIETIINDSLGC